MVKDKIDIDFIAMVREEKGISRMEMAEALGYKSHVAYYRKEKGQRSFSASDIAKLVKILNIEFEDVFIA